MTAYDVIVVGGGPAGSSCARDLVRAGAHVLVIDRAAFPRDKCCAGWITPHVVDALDLDLQEYAGRRTMQVVRGFATSALGRVEIATTYDRAVSYAIRRCEFDHYLLEQSGAQVETGHRVQSIRRSGDRWVVGDRFEAPMLVGAGGHFCPVARSLNPGRDEGPVVVAQEYEFRMTAAQAARCPIDAEVPALYFCPDRLGYGWCVRKDDYLNVGFGRLGGGEFPRRVADFLAFLVRRQRVPEDVTTRWPGHAYRIYTRPVRTLIGDGVLLAGDAAGLAHPVSGEGILTAIESGRFAARVIAESAGNVSRDRLERYRELLEQRYGRPAEGERQRLGLPAALVSWMGVRLMAMPWFARRILLERWFLHLDLPPLSTVLPAQTS